MNLNEHQQRALDHARDVLAEAPRAPRSPDLWYREIRMILAELVAAFDDADTPGDSS